MGLECLLLPDRQVRYLGESGISWDRSISLMLLSKFQQGNTVYVFVDTDNLILKLIWKETGPRIASTFLKNKNKMGGITLSNIIAYNIAI